ncbi:MAG: hypothetical protein IEMM0008_1252 [bacterium]|nr:MAG: hypothetical protein IEMM0008_1252 [bacterium]
MTTIIINDLPYSSSDKAWNGLKLGLTLLAYDQEVTLFLIDDGIDVGRQNHQIPEGEADLEELLKDFLGEGGRVKGCRMCIGNNGSKEPLITGIDVANMGDLSACVSSSDKVISF